MQTSRAAVYCLGCDILLGEYSEISVEEGIAVVLSRLGGNGFAWASEESPPEVLVP